MEKVEDLLNKANELQKNANLDAAEEIYINIINSYPENPHANHNLASLYFTKKDYRKAYNYIKRVIDAKYPLQEYYITASKIFFHLKMFEDCIIVLDKAIAIKPEEMFPLYLKSVLYNELGRYDEAEGLGRELLKKHSNNKYSHNK